MENRRIQKSKILVSCLMLSIAAASLSGCLQPGDDGARISRSNLNAKIEKTDEELGIVDCTPGATQIEFCVRDIPNSQEAVVVKECVLAEFDGRDQATVFDAQDCRLVECQPGYYIDENQCAAEKCTPNSIFPVSCVDEISFSSNAVKNRSCNADGSSYTDGACVLTGCLPGYHQDGNACLANACTPGAVDSITCTSEIMNSIVASKARTCNANGSGYEYGSCILSGCENGYHKEGNACVANTCVPGAVDQISCVDMIPGSTAALKDRTCNSEGSGYAYGSCVLTACGTGFNKDGNSCVANVCTPDDESLVACTTEIPNSELAQKTQTCNAEGTGYIYGSCGVVTCLPGHHNVNGSYCVANTCEPGQSYGLVDCFTEIPNSDEAVKSVDCNSNGSGFLYGSCTLSTCNPGYHKEGNSCLENTCEPDVTDKVECTSEKDFAQLAEKDRTCKSDASGYDFGDCLISECVTGYHKNTSGFNRCDQNTCEPGNTSIVSCSIVGASEATRNQTCNSAGSGFDYDECTLISCVDEFDKVGDSCVLKLGLTASDSSSNEITIAWNDNPAGAQTGELKWYPYICDYRVSPPHCGYDGFGFLILRLEYADIQAGVKSLAITSFPAPGPIEKYRFELRFFKSSGVPLPVNENSAFGSYKQMPPNPYYYRAPFSSGSVRVPYQEATEAQLFEASNYDGPYTQLPALTPEFGSSPDYWEHSISNIQPFRFYKSRIIGKDPSVVSEFSEIIYAPEFNSDISGFSATKGTYSNKVRLTWTKLLFQTVSYKIFRRDKFSGNDFVQIGSGFDINQFDDPTVQPGGKRYEYYVQSYWGPFEGSPTVYQEGYAD